jgi:hypothetical protein
LKETLSQVSQIQGVHILGCLFVMTLIAHMVRADALVDQSANWLLAALLTALNVGDKGDKK